MSARHLTTLEEYQVLRRVLQDVFAEVDAAQWHRRAEQLEAARPRRGDFNGRASRAELTARHQRLTEAAQACRHRAAYLGASRTAYEDGLHDVASPGAAA